MSSSAFALRARYIFTAEGDPIPDGILTVDGATLLAVGQNLSPYPTIDLGNVAILPGLINTHTHLEFSDLEVPLGSPGMPLPAWIRQVIEFRRAVPAQPRTHRAWAA